MTAKLALHLPFVLTFLSAHAAWAEEGMIAGNSLSMALPSFCTEADGGLPVTNYTRTGALSGTSSRTWIALTTWDETVPLQVAENWQITKEHGISSLSQVASQPGALTQEVLRRIADDAIRTEAVRVAKKPVLRVEGNILRFDFGQVLKVDPNPPGQAPKTDPLDIPVRAQLRIQLLRTYYSVPELEAFWHPFFERADSLISEMLNDIESARGNDTSLIATLNARSSQIDQVLKEGIQEYASDHNLTVSSQSIILALSPFRVTLKAVPPGGKISLAHELDAAIEEAQHSDPVDQAAAVDRVLVEYPQSQEVRLLGAYRYKVTWPDPAVVPIRGTIMINSNGTYPLGQ